MRVITAACDAQGRVRVGQNPFRIALYVGPVADPTDIGVSIDGQYGGVHSVAEPATLGVNGGVTYHTHPGVIAANLVISTTPGVPSLTYTEVEVGPPFDGRLQERE